MAARLFLVIVPSGRIDFTCCGKSLQARIMSKSIRLSDVLFEEAQQTGKTLHRTPPQQIEHWAQIGRVLETALSYPAQKNAGSWGNKSDMDTLISEIASSRGRSRVQAVIRKNSKPLASKKAKASSKKAAH